MRKLAMLASILLGACSGPQVADQFGDAKAIIASKCASCHTVPGVNAARGNVGPSLAGIGARQVIAGYFPNSRENMIRWIMRSQTMLPNNAMPNTNLTPAQANRVADYLYTLDK